ncbi:hypothetical protein OH76DRAFT_1413233, partial [Lentinus brumalis]
MLLPDYASAVLTTSRTSRRRLVATLRHVSRLLITVSDACLPASIARSQCALRACASLLGCQNTTSSAPGFVVACAGHVLSTSPSSRATLPPVETPPSAHSRI